MVEAESGVTSQDRSNDLSPSHLSPLIHGTGTVHFFGVSLSSK